MLAVLSAYLLLVFERNCSMVLKSWVNCEWIFKELQEKARLDFEIQP